MKFFNIDLHISVIADIKNIFENLGHQVDSLSLSGHSWVFGQQNNLTKVINQTNWQQIDDEMCNAFYNEYKNELDKYDGFIVTHTPVFSKLYEKFNKPIICVASTRYEYPYTFDKQKWESLNSFLINNKNIIKISNNKFDKNYCEIFTDTEWKLIPSLCDYIGNKYTGTKSQSILFSKKKKFEKLINKESLGRYSWEDLFSYKSIVHIPYNYSTMSIFEQYTANVPLLFPTKEFTTRLFLENLSMTEISYLQVFNKQPESTLNIFGDPNVYNNISTFSDNLDLADFYDLESMPYITYFDNENDLNHILKNLNFADISDKINYKNVERKEQIYKLWGDVLNGL